MQTTSRCAFRLVHNQAGLREGSFHRSDGPPKTYRDKREVVQVSKAKRSVVSFASTPALVSTSGQKNSSTSMMRKESAAADAGQPCVRPSFDGTMRERMLQKGRARCGYKRNLWDRIIVRSAWLNAELQSNW